MGTDTLGLRELKKRRTRQEISNVATRMFIERGFDEVTIAEVAEAAGVAKMTVTNHFPRKEDLVLDLHEEIVAAPARAVAERAAGQSALAALHQNYFADLARHDAMIGFSGPEFARMITGSPALRARLRELQEQREDALAETLAAETGAAPDDIMPRAAAAQLTAVHRVLFQDVLRRTLAGEDDETIAAALGDAAQQAFGLLEPTLGGYAVR
ncbi:TetR/AcrR family transcriptional regulator [Actinoallomurus sp. CA-150999]|uniref:TetR/AcrR family transcriptional regulator n=1 Tax=Actinoallomurus sp. CA-150999 TaxID=3239887 RepID=UPI003D8AB9D8